MSVEIATAPAGWYPDPSNGSWQRWWDGYRWTEHVQPSTGSLYSSAKDAAAGKNTAATWALVEGVIALVLSFTWLLFLCILCSLAAIIWGGVGLSRAARSGVGRGKAVAGLVMGSVALAGALLGATALDLM